MRQALLIAAGVVFDGGIVFDHAADDFEEADAAGKWVGHGLEDHQCKRLLVIDFAGGLGGIGIFFSRFNCRIADSHGRAFGGRGGVVLDEVEKVIESHVRPGRWRRAREDAVFADGFVQSGDEVLLAMVPFSSTLP